MTSSYSSLRDAEFKLYGEIVQLRSIASALQLQETASLADLEALVIGHRFRVAVVGEFNRGKSTAINAMLGAEVLPASIEACSAALNRVTFGTQIGARVVMRGDGPIEQRSEPVPLDQLVDYVTKLSPDAARMSSSVEEAVITYPSRFCRNNVDLIDTPGLNDEPTMTDVTMRAIGRINAAIMVIRAAFSFSHSEQLLLEKLLSRDVTSILFLVTAIDELDADDRPRIIRETRNRILKALRQYADDVYEEGTEEYTEFLKNFGPPQIYGVAALTALNARLNKDSAQEQASGYLEFEVALEQLLATRDTTSAVAQTARKLLKVCDQIDRSILDRREQTTKTQVTFTTTADLTTQRLNQIQAEGRAISVQLRRDTEDMIFRVRQIAQNHGDMFKNTAAQLISTLPIQPNDVVACAGRLLADPHRQTDVSPKLRAWAVSIGQTNTGSSVNVIEQLGVTLHQTLSMAWQETLATMVRQIFTDLKRLREQVTAQHEAWHTQLNTLMAQLPATALIEPLDLSYTLDKHFAASAQERAALFQQLSAELPTLQVQPVVVALRAVTRVMTTATTQIIPDDFLREFQTLCQRAISAGIDMQQEQRLEKLGQIVEHAARTTAPIAEFPSKLIQQLLSSAQQLITSLAKERAQLEFDLTAERQLLDRHIESLSHIVETTKHLLKEFEADYERLEPLQ